MYHQEENGGRPVQSCSVSTNQNESSREERVSQVLTNSQSNQYYGGKYFTATLPHPQLFKKCISNKLITSVPGIASHKAEMLNNDRERRDAAKTMLAVAGEKANGEENDISNVSKEKLTISMPSPSIGVTFHDSVSVLLKFLATQTFVIQAPECDCMERESTDVQIAQKQV